MHNHIHAVSPMQQLAWTISLTEQLSVGCLLTGGNEVVDGAVPIAVFVELRGVGGDDGGERCG